MSHKTQTTPSAAFVMNAGNRSFSDLVNGVQTHRLIFTAQAQVDITVAGALLRNRGSVWALFDEIGLDENGTDRAVLDPRVARFFSEMFAPSQLSATRLAGVGVQAATIIREQLMIHFSSPLSANPAETAFREHNVNAKLRAFVKLNNLAQGGLARLSGGAPTGTITNVTCTVQQVYDSRTPQRPKYIPTYRQQVPPVGSASTDHREDIKTTKYIRAMVIQTDSDAGETGDVIKNLEIRGDFRQIIGPGKVSWDDLLRAMEAEYGGAVYVTGTGLGQSAYLGLHFQKGGRLSNILNPADDVNLRLVMDDQPSANTGAANAKVRIALCELEKDPQLTQSQDEDNVPA